MDIDTLGAGPMREVSTSVGALFVYAISKANLGDRTELVSMDKPARSREVFRRLVSQTRRTRHSEGPPEPLSATILETLTDADVLAVSEALREVLVKSQARRKSATGVAGFEPLCDGETPFDYFARLVDDEGRREVAQMRAIHEKALQGLGGSVGAAFSSLAAQEFSLGGKVRELERLNTLVGRTLEIDDSPMRHFQETMRRQAEDRERVRLTAETTAESAKLLQQLVSTAETFMGGIAKRDEEERDKYRTQLKVAVFSLIASALLAAGSLWYAAKSYQHDLAKNAVDDVASEAAASREERLTAAIEQNATLLQRTTVLVEQLQAIAARQAATRASSPRP